MDRILAVMFASFPASSGDPDAALAGYKLAVGDCDMAQVREAVKRFVRGDVAGFNPRFAPSAAELSLTARRCPDTAMLAEMDRRKALPKPAAAKPEPQMTAEQRARNAAAIAEMRDAYLRRHAETFPKQESALNDAFWAKVNGHPGRSAADTVAGGADAQA